MRVLILFLIGITTSLQAQLSGGDIFIGGTGVIYSNLQRDNRNAVLPSPKQSYIQFSPALGFVLNEKWAIGAIANLTTRLGYVFRAEENIFGIGGLGRRYIRISDQFIFAFSGQLVYNLITQKSRVYNPQKSENETLKSYANGLSTEVAPMFIFFPTPAWGFEAGIGSVGLAWANNRTEKSRDFQVFAGLGQFKLGINYYIRK